MTVQGRGPRSDTQRPRPPTTQFPAGGPLNPLVARPLDRGRCWAFPPGTDKQKGPPGTPLGNLFYILGTEQ